MANYLEVSSTPSDEFSTLSGYQTSVEVPRMWAQVNRTGYATDAKYISQVNKNIMINTVANLPNYGSLTGRTTQSLPRSNNTDITYQTAPSNDYMTYSTEMNT